MLSSTIQHKAIFPSLLECGPEGCSDLAVAGFSSSLPERRSGPCLVHALSPVSDAPALEKDAPEPRAIMRQGAIIAVPQVGGLHRRYERRAA
jgi:hypothetical protein